MESQPDASPQIEGQDERQRSVVRRHEPAASPHQELPRPKPARPVTRERNVQAEAAQDEEEAYTRRAATQEEVQPRYVGELRMAESLDVEKHDPESSNGTQTVNARQARSSGLWEPCSPQQALAERYRRACFGRI